MPSDPVIYSSNLTPGLTVNSPVLQAPTFTPKMVVLAGAKTLTALDSGTTYWLNLVGGFTVTLPALAAGLFYRFIVKTAPTTAYFVTSTDTDTIVGSVFSASGAAQDSENSLGADTIKFVASTAVLGDSADVWCDGVAWYGRAYCAANGGIIYAEV